MISDKKFQQIQEQILAQLGGLQPDLYYHSIEHTMDVVEKSESIANQQGIFTAEEMKLLKIAALYHDSGFLVSYADHEKESCLMLRENLAEYDLEKTEIEILCGLIMSTKIPQAPNTFLEQVICDADLDYLGREDFFPISNLLFRELNVRGIVANMNQWNAVQIKFFNEHRYFTPTSIALRTDAKMQHLDMIKKALG